MSATCERIAGAGSRDIVMLILVFPGT